MSALSRPLTTLAEAGDGGPKELGQLSQPWLLSWLQHQIAPLHGFDSVLDEC